MGFGNPMYYAVTLQKPTLIRVLHRLGCYVTLGCDAWFSLTPTHYASRVDNEYSRIEIEFLKGQTQRVASFLVKNFARHKYRKLYLVKLKAIRDIQRVGRGLLGRILADVKRGGDLSDEDSAASSTLRGQSSTIMHSAILEETSHDILNEESEEQGDAGSVGSKSVGGGSVGSSSVKSGRSDRSGRSGRSGRVSNVTSSQVLQGGDSAVLSEGGKSAQSAQSDIKSAKSGAGSAGGASAGAGGDGDGSRRGSQGSSKQSDQS
jgi:hypothetical protein